EYKSLNGVRLCYLCKKSAVMQKPNSNKRNEKPAKKSGSGSPKPALNKRAQKPKPAAKTPAPKKNQDEIRLNKYIANSGVCSRRDADIYIQSGNVKVNGNVVTEMGYKVQPGDSVVFDGVSVTPERKVYVLLNKPKNFTTASEEEGDMRNVLELVRAASTVPLKPVGRMDKNTTGLLL